MGLSLSLFIVLHLLFLFSQLHLLLTHSSPLTQHLCHDNERLALLQFKESFILNKSASYGDPLAYPKVASWKLEGNKSDCCSWDGVECDEHTGHVIGLDLSNSLLYGSINSSSSLFHLLNLQRLNLANNDFIYSQIPSQVRDLSGLKELNLSCSGFSGGIPLEISQLSHLSSLDLSGNEHVFRPTNLSLRKLIRNLTQLEKLDLSWVNISSIMPDILTNLTSLMSLTLKSCGLFGKIPIGIFNLPNLQNLSASHNEGIIGSLPSFTWSAPLEELHLSCTSLSGKLPTSMGNLDSLILLSMWGCNFTGSIPSSFSNLTKLTYLVLPYNAFMGNIPFSLGNLTKLIHLDLSYNGFVGNIPFSLGNLTKLTYLDLSYNGFVGNIPFSLGNLEQLSNCHISNNQLSGEVHFGLMNESRLVVLDLHDNRLTGPITLGPCSHLRFLDLAANEFLGQIPDSIFKLKNLEFLDFSGNHLNGTMEFAKFLKLKCLVSLHLSRNELSLVIKEPIANATFQNFEALGFSSCNLSKFPNFLRNQDKLEYLELPNNNIHGQVPKWIWNISKISLQFFDMSHNFLTGFGQHPISPSWIHLDVFDLRSNLLQGSLPIPPFSTLYFSISNNSLTGNIPEIFCNLRSIRVLDLAHNNLSGPFPPCLGNSSANLLILNLRRNKFQGSISKMWTRGSGLRMIIFSENKFQGLLPRSLANCTMLKVLDLSNNQFLDSFPFWLGHHPNLEVLSLHSNNFYGLVGNPKTYFIFPNLRILDISHNDFTGKLPSVLFENWKAKKFEDLHNLTYIHEDPGVTINVGSNFSYWLHAYNFSMTLTNKGTNILYEKVQEGFLAIDFSSNKFVGEIPESIGNLMECYLLNLSNNALTGWIPLSLGNLSKLEALDLSQNQLVGEIPQQLTQLTFLEVFNVSHNNLSGPIPQGRQFNTFESSSFEGNPKLCGTPLTKKCVSFVGPSTSSPILKESQDSISIFKFGWKSVAIGYGSGLVFGVIIGHILFVRKQDWLMKTFRISQRGGRGCRY